MYSKWIVEIPHEAHCAPGQIDVAAGEEVEVVVPDSNGWTKIRKKSGEGMVPTKKLGQFSFNM